MSPRGGDGSEERGSVREEGAGGTLWGPDVAVLLGNDGSLVEQLRSEREGAEKHRGLTAGCRGGFGRLLRGPDVVARRWKWDADACVCGTSCCAVVVCGVCCVGGGRDVHSDKSLGQGPNLSGS